MTPLSERGASVLVVAENTRVGGINRYVTEIAPRLRDRGWDVTVAAIWNAADDQWLAQACRRSGVRFVALSRRSSVTELPRVTRRLRRLVRVLQPAVVHTQAHYSGVLTRLVRGRGTWKLVNTVHGFGDAAQIGLRAWYWLDWKTFGMNEVTLANSAYTAGRLHALKLGKEIRVNHLGVPVRPTHTGTLRDLSAPIIGYVGRLTEEKGPDVLIQAFEIIARGDARVRLLLVGSGPMADELERRIDIAGLGNRVFFAGKQIDVEPFYEVMSVIAVPSRKESFGLSILEAQLRGVPVVANAIEAIPEIIEDGHTGLLVANNNPDELARQILRCINQPNLAVRLATAARAAATRWNPDSMIDEIVAAYRSESDPAFSRTNPTT